MSNEVTYAEADVDETFAVLMDGEESIVVGAITGKPYNEVIHEAAIWVLEGAGIGLHRKAQIRYKSDDGRVSRMMDIDNSVCDMVE